MDHRKSIWDRDRYKPIMNSSGASGSRGSKRRSGGGSAEHGEKEVYSRVGEHSGREDASKDSTKLKTQGKSKAGSRQDKTKEAFAAMARVREPFIADVSQIAAAKASLVLSWRLPALLLP